MSLLDGKTVLVTGVLTEGSIAFHVARLAQLEGAQVILTSFGRQARLTAAIARRLPTEPPIVQLDVTDDEDLAAVAEALAAMASGQPGLASLPVDLRGTAFQATVWSALRRIPAGETRTYTEIAQEIGSPRSVRAVARACATNRLALVVPCHRVVRADGSMGGYRWGLEIKERLLDLERTAAG